jgi:uncharacterized protein
MVPRRILTALRAWASSPRRKPLVVRGARQVGKTTAVRMLGEDFEQFIELDLEVSADANLFRRRLGVRDLFQAILLSRGLSLRGGSTLLFLDEIQESPEAIAMLRQFYEQMPDLHVVAAGSLLETMLGRIDVSFPVGRVQHLYMHPMSFEEFLLAHGEEGAVEALATIPCPTAAIPHLLDRFHRYALVGGMPEIVAAYAESADLTALDGLYSSLLTSYVDDVARYARNPTVDQVIRHAIESAPFEAGNRIKFEGFGRSSYRSREMGEALRTLQRAMVLFLLYPTTCTEIPLVPDHRKSPRLQFLDTGLLNHAVGLQACFFEHDDLHAFHRGRLAEHVVGQELLCMESATLRKPVFWVRDKRQSAAEVDFLLQHDGRVVPVEVKAGARGTLRSLHQFIDRSNCALAVRLHAGPLARHAARTIAGRAFTLLDLPYCLASRVGDHVDWARE